MTSSLPIDEILPKIVAAIDDPEVKTVVVEAPPGAGKTTRLPPALLGRTSEAPAIWVSEPRRVAARLAARRVAEERNQPLGEKIGYQVRFDDKTSQSTELVFMTEGLLLNRLLSDPKAARGRTIFLDEVHERSADLDVILARLKYALDAGEDFTLIAMSATLDAERLAAYLGPGTRRFKSAGRAYPVEISYLPQPDERPLAVQVRSAVKQARNEQGDMLVFLPGAAEIRSCQESLAQLDGLLVQSLYGDMPLGEQVKVISPTGSQQRVILATNIAESSLTIPGVTTVIDSGLSRSAEFDPWTAVTRLETVAVSQARATQRAGRAGRLCAGRALRLYTRGQFEARPEQDAAELVRSDLSSIYLQILIAERTGGPSLEAMKFLNPPPNGSWEQAKEHLKMLGAVDETGLTPLGEEMGNYPLSPRLARALLGAIEGNQPAHGCLSAALLSERELLISARRYTEHDDPETTDSDLDERIDRFWQLADCQFDRRVARDLDIDLSVAKQVDRIACSLFGQARAHSRQLARECEDDLYRQLPNETDGLPLARALLAGFIDRIAQRRGTSRDLVLQTGTQATLSQKSGVHAPLLLALSADAPGGRRRKATVRIAARLDPDWLFDFGTQDLCATDEYRYDERLQRVELISRLSFGKIVLDESRTQAPDDNRSREVLAEQLLKKDATRFDPEALIPQTRLRLELLLVSAPELFSALEEGERADLVKLSSHPGELEKRILLTQLEGSTFRALDASRLSSALYELLPPICVQSLEREAPLFLRLDGGLKVSVHYESERSPWIEARLQNFFSMTETPQICLGRVTVQVHLLAPNHRAVQVTSDLAGFWQRHYPELRKQLMRRYPKHLWPEDGATAQPPEPGRIR